MKKPYQKPRVYAESFALLEHIASCTANTDVTNVTYRDRNSCTYNDMNVTLFNVDASGNGLNGCVNEYFDPAMESFDEYLASFKPENGGGCYNSFADGNFFAS